MSNNSTSQVVVIGSTNIDLIMQVAQLPKPGETVGDAAFSQALGGKGANQALAAARSGAHVVFVSVVGDDDYGRHARDFFTTQNIDVTLMKSATGSTGTALIFVDQHGENCIGVAPGANALCDVHHIRLANRAMANAAVVLLQLEIPLASVRAALSADTKARLILNAAPMHDLTPADLSKLDTLIVNQTELSQVVARCTPTAHETGVPENAEACNGLHALGVANVVVTLGKEGVFLSHSGAQSYQPGFAVEATDTTGAGDTFCGAFASRLAKAESFEDAATYAQAAAALACTQLGAQGAIPEESAVHAFLKRNADTDDQG